MRGNSGRTALRERGINTPQFCAAHGRIVSCPPPSEMKRAIEGERVVGYAIVVM